MTELPAMSGRSSSGSESPASAPDNAVTAGGAFARIPRGGTPLPAPPSDEALVRLRELLFSREIALIDRIAAALEDPRYTTGKVSEVLAEAVQMRSGKDPHLAMALEPVVGAIVKTSLNTSRNDFINALFPLMGPTIRKSIAESFRSMLGSFSKSVEMAFSWKGLKWRMEALRSGKPFSEIVMLNTLVYRVEQLFFIHSESGLVLSHIAGDSGSTQDADMVSAMLTAIQDFVRDCFAGGSDDSLDSLQLGDHTIYIEKSPAAYIACVVRGTPPAGFHDQLRATLDLMLVEYADALEGFSGDIAPFADAIRYLDPCLQSRYADADAPLPLWARALPALLLLGLLGGGVYRYYDKGRQEAARIHAQEARDTFMATMRRNVDYLRAEPGLMVINVTESEKTPWDVLVLKDAMTRAPEEVLRENGVDLSLFAVKTVPFVSYDPAVVVKRVKKAIQPPDTVEMTFDETGLLAFKGTAPMSWIVSTREEARALPGVEAVDLAGVHDPMMDQITAMVREVEGTVIEFPLGQDTPVPADVPKLKKAIDTLASLERIAHDMGFSAALTIYGHADTIGNEARNFEISQARARTVAAKLYARGSGMPVAIYGLGAEYPKTDKAETGDQPGRRGDQTSRRIELRVHFTLAPTADPMLFQK